MAWRDARLRKAQEFLTTGAVVSDRALPVDDQDLLLRLRSGDDAAFDAIFRHWYAILVRHAAQRIGGRREAAEEVVQDVMLELWRRRSALDPAGSVRAYLFTAVRNRTLNVLRHDRATARAIPLFGLEQRDRQRDGEDADVGARETEVEAAVRLAIDALPPRCRQVFLLNRVHGRRNAEIARELGVTVKAVEANMGRALRILRVALAPWLSRDDAAAAG